MRRIGSWLGGLLCGTLLVAAPVGAATPTTGVYQGIVDGTPNEMGHNEGEGYLRVRVIDGSRKIVPPGTFTCGGIQGGCIESSIQAPTWGWECNKINADLEAARIPIAAGAFDYRGKANIGESGARMNIRFKGTWVTATKVTGFTRVWDTGCDSGKMRWTMRTPP